MLIISRFPLLSKVGGYNLCFSTYICITYALIGFKKLLTAGWVIKYSLHSHSPSLPSPSSFFFFPPLNPPWIFTGQYKRLLLLITALCASSIVSNSVRPHGLWPAGLHHLWDFPGRKLECVVISSSGGSSWAWGGICASCIGRWILYPEPPGNLIVALEKQHSLSNASLFTGTQVVSS